jgi:hypothetical protein
LIALLLVVAVAGYWAGHLGSSAHRDKNDAAVAAVGGEAMRRNPARAYPAAKTQAKRLPAPPATARSPLPPTGTPLKQIRAQLQSLADAGDAEAASRLYADTRRCADVRRLRATNLLMSRFYLTRQPDISTPEKASEHDRIVRSMQKQLDFVSNNEVLCAGLADDEINAVTPLALQAAQLGDTTAADCYVGDALYHAQGLLDHPEWLVDYKENALSLAHMRIEAGDWHMVALLARAYSSNFGITALSQLTGHDDVQTYRYTKLQSLGATGARAPNEIAEALDRETSEISADARRAADAWALDAYQRYFAANVQDNIDRQPPRCSWDSDDDG